MIYKSNYNIVNFLNKILAFYFIRIFNFRPSLLEFSITLLILTNFLLLSGFILKYLYKPQLFPSLILFLFIDINLVLLISSLLHTTVFTISFLSAILLFIQFVLIAHHLLIRETGYQLSLSNLNTMSLTYSINCASVRLIALYM